MTAAAVCGLAACNLHDNDERAALERGRDAAAACIERFHDQGHTYAECVRYVAGKAGAPDIAWQRLGALTQGWFGADLAARQTGDADAVVAARVLLAEADAEQRRLAVPDAALCALLAQDCTLLGARRAAVRGPAG